ncbi:APC family permease [Micrococcus sp. ACRRV]|nr:APC family permease [Micrococcus sp. ACRRV]
MVGAGAFTSLGLAALLTGGHVGALAAALGLAVAVATCNALSTAQLAAVHPASGGTYVYGRRQIGPTAGFVAGWGFVTGKTASVAAMATTAGLYLFPDSPLAARLAGAAAVVILTAVALRGITRTAQATVAILVPVLAVLGLTIVAGLAGGRAAADTPVSAADPAGVLAAAGVLFFAFAGYARVATMGEEVEDPRRTIPRAVLGALAFTVVLYALLAAALVAALGGTGLAASEAPVRATLEASLGAGWGWAAVVGAVLACAGAMLNLLAGISRTGMAMAREGDLPRPLARVDERTAVPWAGQVTVAVAVILLVLTTDVLTVVGFSSFGVLAYYAVANLSALTLRPEQRTLRVPRAVNVLGLGLCLVIAFTLPPASVAAMVGVFLIGLGGRWFVRSRRPDRIG